jgi:hypothetical protein
VAVVEQYLLRLEAVVAEELYPASLGVIGHHLRRSVKLLLIIHGIGSSSLLM